MESNKPIYVLGTGMSHDGSACLLKNGKIVVAVEKERITRIKHDGRNDNQAIKYCLDAENISIADLSVIVQCGDACLQKTGYHYLDNGPHRNRLVEKHATSGSLITISHHLAHAYNAIGTCPFEEMAILVIDGSGQELKYCMDLNESCLAGPFVDEFSHLYSEKDSFYYYRDGLLSTLYKDFSQCADYSLGSFAMFPLFAMHSIGDMYGQASRYCIGASSVGRNDWEQGKLMGLAPYGRKGIYNHRIFNLRDGRVFVNYDWQQEFDRPCRSYSEFKSNFQYYADIACWVQKETEDAILYLVNHRSRLCNTRKLAYTGGVALNAVANGKLLNNSSFNELYITPSAGDNGLAIGCAYYGWLEILKKGRIIHHGGSCFGKGYSNSEIGNILEKYIRPGRIQVKSAIEYFFRCLPNYCRIDKIGGISYKVQFIIKDVNVYLIELVNNDCKVFIGTTCNSDTAVIIDGRSFVEWMLGIKTTSYLEISGKIVVQGNISPIEGFFDFDVLKEKMRDALFADDSIAEKVLFTKEPDIISKAARILQEGNVIGWFQGGSEFGPRALGHRSILADPRKANIKDHINSRIKKREDFRPFAPSVLREDVSTYFQFDGESPYMILVVNVRPEWQDKIPGVVHADGSSRIQTVTACMDHRYYELLGRFKQLTGIGVLLNTSFNQRGMPIVETPLEALDLFFDCDLDYLVIEDYIVYKDAKLLNCL
jgi:predicted NodU family carbamoyl transferase